MDIDPRTKLMTQKELQGLSLAELREMDMLVPLSAVCKIINITPKDAANRFRAIDEEEKARLGVLPSRKNEKKIVYSACLDELAAFLLAPKTYAQLLKDLPGYYAREDVLKRYPLAVNDVNWPKLQASPYYYAPKDLILLPDAWTVLAPGSDRES